MNEEIASLENNQTQELIRLSYRKWAVIRKWVYQMKEGTLGVENLQYKIWLVARVTLKKKALTSIKCLL